MTEADWTEEGGDAPGSDWTESGANEAPALAFPSLPEFVNDFLLEVAVRHLAPERGRWCVQWWDHEEAVLRLESLWDAFEALRVEPGTGLAVWIRDYLDPTMGALTGENSPFRKCDHREGKHEVTPRWPHEEPPAGMFRRATSEAETSED